MKCSTVVLESAIDWLTLTSKHDYHNAHLSAEASLAVQQEEQRGNYRKPFSWRGYVGEHCGAVSWGERKDGVLVQVSGGLADDWFDALYPYADNCSRIDVQTTVRVDPFPLDLASRSYADGLAWSPPNGIKPSLRIMSGSDGGSTLYVGSGSSDQLARLYNKAAESGDHRYRDSWRWEVEYKSELAAGVAGAFSGSSDRPAYCAGLVHQHFSERGLRIPWSADHIDVPSRSVRPRSDVLRQLQWLDATVKPVVEKLIEAGYEDQVRMLLGLLGATWAPFDSHKWRGFGHHKDPNPEE